MFGGFGQVAAGRPGDEVRVQLADDVWEHGIVTSADDAYVCVSVVPGTVTAAEIKVEKARVAEKLKPFAHTARPKDSGRLCDLTLVEVDSMVQRVSEALAARVPPHEKLFTEELPPFAERVLKSKTRTDDDLELLRRSLRSLTDVCVHYLAQTERPLPTPIVILLGRIFLDDPNCDHYLQTYGGIRPDHELAKFSIGWAAKFPSGGASRFYVSNVNYFHEQRGFDHVIARLQSATRASRAAALAAGEDLSSIDYWQPPKTTTQLASRTLTMFTSAMKQASSNPLMALPYLYQQLPVEDALYETATLSNVLYIPRLCFTDDWFARYYVIGREAMLDRVMFLSAEELSRASWRAVLAIVKNAHRCGEQALITGAGRAEEIIGEPAIGFTKWFELWDARFDARVALARTFLERRGDRR